MKSVTVELERDEDGWWIASAREIAGCHTQGRSIRQARERFLEALSLFIDNADTVAIVEDIRLPAAARRLVTSSTDARAKADEVQRRAQESTKEAVQRLTSELDMSVRDVSEVLGLSHQRVQQIARENPLRTSQPTKHLRKARKASAAR